MTFLRAFVADFSGKFEEILQLAEEFRSFCSKMRDTSGIQELDEFEAHQFLEKRGETKRVVEMREALKNIDIDSNNRVAFIEYLLFKYKKTPKDLFTAKPNSMALKKMEEAIENYKRHFAEVKKREERVRELEEIIKQGGAGAPKAKVELRQLQMRDKGQDAKNEMEAMHKRLQAQRALKDPKQDEEEEFKKEQERLKKLEEEKKREEDKKRQDARNRLKERASMFQ